MPNMLCFCVFECAGMDIKEMDKNHGKMTKTSTRLERARDYEAIVNFIWSIEKKLLELTQIFIELKWKPN